MPDSTSTKFQQESTHYRLDVVRQLCVVIRVLSRTTLPVGVCTAVGGELIVGHVSNISLLLDKGS